MKQPPPDVQKEEWNACSAPETFAQGEIGYRQLGDRVYDFLEKQVSVLHNVFGYKFFDLVFLGWFDKTFEGSQCKVGWEADGG